MSPTSAQDRTGRAHAGLAVRCDDGGIVLEVMDDSLGLVRPLVVGTDLAEAMLLADVHRFESFLSEVRSSGASYNRGMDTEGPDGKLSLRLAGLRSPDGLLVIAATSDDELASLVEDFMGMNNDLITMVRALSKELGQAHGGSNRPDQSAEIDELRRQLEDAQASQSEFLSAMSHELRTPLNSIIGFSDLMRNGLTGEMTDEQKSQLGMISDAGHYLLDMVIDILEMSRLSEPSPEAFTTFEAEWVVSEAVDRTRLNAAEKGLAVRVEAPQEPVMLRSDKERIRQVLVRLISNAIRFTDEGQVVIRFARDGALVRFEVSDTGPGIAPEDLSKVFDDFRQLAVPGVAKSSGAGLGLPISRRLIQQLGGHISVSSELGVGSTFSFEVPASDG